MIIPDKNLFIVSSAIKPSIGIYSFEERFSQTVQSLKSVREKVPNAIIVSADVSLVPLTQMEKDIIYNYSDVFIDLSQEHNTKTFSERGMKSHAENALLFATLLTLRHNHELSKMLSSVKRIFKFGGRTELEDTFDIKEYDNLFGKFVFKKRIPTWMHPPITSNLLITRMFSFCPSLYDTYLNVIQKNFTVLDSLDTEHAHFLNIPKEHLVEFDTLHCWGRIAGTGQIEHY